MPIYQYQCRECGHQLEALQKMSEPKLEDCPACAARRTLRKQLTAAAFSLKGTGWYATDFKNSGGKPATGDGASGDASQSAGQPSPKAAASGDDAKAKDTSSSSAGASS